MTTTTEAPAATFVVFGVFGDLTRRLLAPSLVNLKRAGLLSEQTRIIGVDHIDGTDADFRRALSQFSSPNADGGADLDHDWLADRASYLQGDFNDNETYLSLLKRGFGNAAFYLATLPQFFGVIVDHLADAGLMDETAGFRRVIIEKPFGSDLASAKALNSRILSKAPEEQTYRIDHFLGKETVQNLMVFRFGNPFFEAIWNSHYVDQVQITATETVTVGARGKFYDVTGALRDMVPNHLFQLLAMVCMEPPNSFDAEAIRTEKAKVVTAVRSVAPSDVVRGVYGPGTIDGESIAPYQSTPGIAPNSTTETYVALKVLVDTWRWSGTPFYLRTGKALSARDTEIVIQFRPMALKLFKSEDLDQLPPNRLVIQVQPNEGFTFDFGVKAPGPEINVTNAAMEFRYADRFNLPKQTGYETLLYDVLVGDQTLFQRADQIEAGWRAVQPVLDAWAAGGRPEPYEAGGAGPAAADHLIERDGRTWHPIG